MAGYAAAAAVARGIDGWRAAVVVSIAAVPPTRARREEPGEGTGRS